ASRESYLARPIRRPRIVIGHGAARVTSASEAIRRAKFASRMTSELFEKRERADAKATEKAVSKLVLTKEGSR
ncbi:hypothetical protein, partial [Bradyrhizobium sp. 163]|uniref:hypothetical protein n=1 Tax=Bradyrhizobium sp. 163 TaxID=2782636 RepID=UPI001FF70C94